MKKNHKSITFSYAAANLRVSESTVLRLVQRGTLHATKPELKNGHWTRRIVLDRSFQDERARRLNGLKAPRRKHIPDTDSVQREFERKAREKWMNDMCEQFNMPPALDHGSTQTVTPSAEPQPAFLVNASGYLATWHLQQPTLFLTANKAIFDFNGELDLVDRVAAHVDKTADYVSGQISSAEGIYTRCTAILAAACVLQLILAIYFSLCHFNII